MLLAPPQNLRRAVGIIETAHGTAAALPQEAHALIEVIRELRQLSMTSVEVADGLVDKPNVGDGGAVLLLDPSAKPAQLCHHWSLDGGRQAGAGPFTGQLHNRTQSRRGPKGARAALSLRGG
jgi:hypothetical protein